jgi:hypothetical protein
VNFQFYGYTVRETVPSDWELAGSDFWINSSEEPRRENFLVMASGKPSAFFQVERVTPAQTRLHFQALPSANPKKILRGITKLVPLIEQALCLRGVRHIFFTSHSLAMVAFMEKRLGYRLAKNTDGGADGVVMFKEMRQPSGRSCGDLGGPKVEFHAAERGSK